MDWGAFVFLGERMPSVEPNPSRGKNVLGQPLSVCGCEPMTGFYRTGCCETGPDDFGVHTVCCMVDEKFLAASKALGNDLSTPMPQYGFAGLKPGDKWCVVRGAVVAGSASRGRMPGGAGGDT